jgi:hypothetical protein
MDEVLPEVRFDMCQAASLLQSMFDFYRFAAGGGEPLQIRASACGDGVTVSFAAVSDRIDGPSFYRLLDPRPCPDFDGLDIPAGSVRRLIEANGGSLRLDAAPDGLLAAEVFFPAA